MVDGLDMAIAHIGEYGSSYRSIVTESQYAADRVLLLIVPLLCTAPIFDGGEFGMGQIGIATGRLHTGAVGQRN